MVKNRKIRTKISLAFGLIIALSLGTILFLLTQMNHLAQTTQLLYREPYTASNAAWSIRRNLIDSEREIYRLISAEEAEFSSILSEINRNLDEDAKEMNEAIVTIEGLLGDEDQELSRLLNEIKSTSDAGTPVRQQIISSLQSGDKSRALALMNDQYEPLFEACNIKVLAMFELVEADAVSFTKMADSASRTSITVGVILMILSVIVAIATATAFANSLVSPLQQLERAANEMAKGNLKSVDLMTYHSQDEMGQLSDSLRFTMVTLHSYVAEISAVLIQISKGDFTISDGKITDFLGDFSEIKYSLVTILKSFNITLGDINQASGEVDNSANQVSGAAQLLSEGAAEQAASIEELTATVEEISHQIRETADNARSADELTDRVDVEVVESTRHMKEMNDAMEAIHQSSQEIGKIIKTIEDIAFQTNILALNAAVEAARAGTAGKGFAVVADEVRNLAGKSAEASKNTAALIAGATKAVEHGMTISTATTHALESVASTTRQVVDTVTRIADASRQQAGSVEEITARVEQISAVVQTNSATAEQSAAASEGLSHQADRLNHLVNRFRLFEAK